MKKRLVAILLVVATCMLVLSACSVVESLEKDVQVTLKVNDETWGPYTVNSFNNAIVPVPEAPTGQMFFGWTADADWQSKNLSDVVLSQSKGLIRYDDVKDFVKEGSITLYPVFGEAPRHDIAIAWYAKENTSGLNQSVIDDFTTALRAYLVSLGKDPDTMDIVIRAYNGNVGTTCGAIKDDGDIDIMVGWAATSNLQGTGGLIPGTDFLKNYGNIILTGAAKARYAAKVSDTELCNLVYEWILTTYGGEGGAVKDYEAADTPVTPDPDPTPEPVPPSTDPITITDNTLVVSIWNRPAGDWINAQQIEKLKTDFYAYLTERSVDVTTLNITWRVETEITNVAALVNAVKTAGDVDFILACGNNVNSTGNLENLEKIQISDGTYMTSGRYIAVLNKDNPRQLAKILYEFISNQKYPEQETPVTPDPGPTPEPPATDPITITDNVLVVSIWNNKNGAWITAEQIEKLKTDFEAYLTERRVDVTTLNITWRVETEITNVASLVNAVKTAGDVDFILACGNNVNSTGNLENLEKIQINDGTYMTSGRYIAVLNKDNPRQLAKVLYEFISGQKYPEQETPVEEDTTLVVSIWNRPAGDWISAEQIAKLKTDFTAYLTEQGVDVSTINITWRVETEITNVASLVNAVKTAGDVDFVLACGNNVNSTGNLKNLEKLQITDGVYMAANRYIAVLNKDDPNTLAVMLYEFISKQAFPEQTTEGGSI